MNILYNDILLGKYSQGSQTQVHIEPIRELFLSVVLDTEVYLLELLNKG